MSADHCDAMNAVTVMAPYNMAVYISSGLPP